MLIETTKIFVMNFFWTHMHPVHLPGGVFAEKHHVGGSWGDARRVYASCWSTTNLLSFLLLRVFTSVSILVKISQEMRPWECTQMDTQIHRCTDANWFYNLSHAICYSCGADNYCSYGADNKWVINADQWLMTVLSDWATGAAGTTEPARCWFRY